MLLREIFLSISDKIVGPITNGSVALKPIILQKYQIA